MSLGLSFLPGKIPDLNYGVAEIMSPPGYSTLVTFDTYKEETKTTPGKPLRSPSRNKQVSPVDTLGDLAERGGSGFLF